MDGLRLYPLWREALKVFISENMAEPGTIITEEWKLKNFGITKPDSGSVDEIKNYQLKLLAAFENFRDELLTGFQVHLKPVGKGSHIVLAPHEQTKEAWSNGVTEIKRTMDKMKKRLENVDVVKLTHEERKENIEASARSAMFTGMFRKVRRMEIETSEPEKLS